MTQKAQKYEKGILRIAEGFPFLCASHTALRAYTTAQAKAP